MYLIFWKNPKVCISHILSSNIVLFLALIVDSIELLTYSNKYSVFNINDYILIPRKWVNLKRILNVARITKFDEKISQDLGKKPSVGDTALHIDFDN